MVQPRTLVLTPDARAALETARARDPRADPRERASALLRIADGWSVRRVARSGLLRPRRPETVADWLDRWLDTGLDGLVQEARRPRGLPP